MYISELIKMLTETKEKYGDMKVEIRDVDNGTSYFDVGAYEDHATEFEIEEGIEGSFTIEYYD